MASPVRPRGRQINAYQLVALFLAFVLVSGVGGVLAAGLLVPLAAGANTATDTAVEVFDELPADLEPGPLSEQSRIYANDGTTRLATFYTENRIVVPLDQVSEPMKNAVIAIEDKRFWEHGGVDVEGIPRAFVNNLTGGSTQGASTLTQQYVKNVLIEQAVRDGDVMAQHEAKADTLGRKAREAKLAISLEKKMSKEEILQGYLNIAQFGRSVYGVETAARHYFGVSAKDLNYLQAATIAGITKAPSTYDPTADPEKAQNRRNVVLNTMYQQGYITKEEYDAGLATPIADTLAIQPLEAGCQASGGSAFFCDYVTKIIMSDPVFGETKADREALLYRGGLDIYTTLDPTMQAAAEQHAAAAVPADDPSQIEDSIVTIEPGTGKILAMAQNRAFDNTQDPAPNTTAVNYSVDQAHGSSNGFSPGSTWKPFVLAEWLKEGHSLYDTVSANKRTWTLGRDFRASCARFGNEQWTPANSDGPGSGSMSVLQATFNSVNTAYTTMASQLDLCGVANTAKAAGFQPSMLADAGEVKVRPSMILGTQNSSPLHMAAAYATFASGGTYCSPIAITRVVAGDGTELPVPSAGCQPGAIDPNIANTVTYALQQVLTQGSGRGNALADGRPAAGKTGTANNNTHTWFIGYTPQVVTAVWIGNAESDVPMNGRFTINGKTRPYWYGSSLAAPTWRDYMNQILAGQPAPGFADPDWGRVNAPTPPPSTPSTPEGGQGGDQGGGDPGAEQPGGDDSGADQPDTEADGGDRGDRGDRGNGAGRESDLGAWLEGLGGRNG
ncbi:transglycosylase domain-containing protein [Cellulosimicrobium funkei]|uniref:transglycosylase domain-containing protein n=1 Tax=Cellulosimicrobium TaxID=157920 RepID=UPI001459A30F|nr:MULTISPECIES: transglycosylase domain-containing protein [Cellulosimicrobium]MCM3534089.1 transglycosylase domain-containing protein [Cellulosimicrobium funkei]NMF28736.1 penicillin-binding protein [Cellulosimicrobium aquatile]